MRFRRADLMAFVALLFAAAAMAFAAQNGASSLAAQGVDGSNEPAITAPGIGPDAAPSAPGAIAKTFNYQGLLRKADGSLVNGPTTMTIRVYDLPAGNANPALYTEQFANVPVRNGIFNVILGDTPTGLPDIVFAATPRFIEITLAGEAAMTPRQRIHPVPWALSATSAESANSAGSAGVADKLKDNATTNGLTVNGAFQAQSLKLNGVREITDRSGTTAAAAYVVNTQRWIIETQDQDNNHNPAKLDETRLAEYCIDEDGCRVWIGMRNWTADRGPDQLVLAGPYNWTISKTGTGTRANQRYYEFHDWDGNAISRDGHFGGWDGDGTQWLAMSRWDCHLRDYGYTSGAAQPDNTMGFYFQNTEDNYPANNMTCVLIIED